MISSRELVYQTLEFKSPIRVPRHLWVLPWAAEKYQSELEKIKADFPADIVGAPTRLERFPKTFGDQYQEGEYIDAWGCTFHSIQRGVIGEVKSPLVVGDDWEDLNKVHIPREYLSFDKQEVNRFCRLSSKFVMSGGSVNPFERLQYIRGSEQLYIDLAFKTPGLMRALEKIHDFNCELLQTWAQTEIDALSFSDDWGAQDRLLIHPKTWIELFKPLYRDYIEIAHRHGKKIFMHSDGHTLAIFPHLIEMGLDAVNAQIFCIGIDNLAPFKGKITFWGEIDRQYLLSRASLQEVDAAVRQVKRTLWSDGGCIAQCEFGVGARPENVTQVFQSWEP